MPHRRGAARGRALIVGLAALAAATAAPAQTQAQAQAQPWPTRPVRLIVSFAAGGPNDLMARILGQAMSPALGQPVVVDNKPGAGGLIGNEAAAKAPPDGYTLLFTSATFAMLPSLFKTMPYDTLADFTPITRFADTPMVVMTSAAAPYKTLQDLIAAARQRPAAVTYASGGVGSTTHFAAAMLQAAAGVDFTHVPYKGGAPALTGVLSGESDFWFDSVPSALPFLDDGKLRALAVAQGTPMARLPQVPTMEAAGLPGFAMTQWFGVLAPSKTPPDVVARLTALALDATRSEAVRARVAELAAAPVGDGPDSYRAFLAAEVQRYRQVAVQAKIDPQ